MPDAHRRRIRPGIAALVAGAAVLLAGGTAAAASAGAHPGAPAATDRAEPARPAALPRGLTRVARGTQGLTAGMALGDIPAAQTDAELARFESDGANTVSIFVWWITSGPRSDTLSRFAGTQTDASLTREIRAAEHDRLAVSLTPVFYCSACEGGWRGTMDPADPSAFFADYEAFIDHYATLAQQTGVTTFFAGSEMSSLEGYTQEWEDVIAGVRRRFSGQVAYEENWDVLGQARFLDDVDLIGVSAYFPLDDAPDPNLTRLLSDWTSSQSSVDPGRDWVAELAGLASHTGKPILFGEVGYMSGDYAARQPFLDFEGQADWQLQSDLYQALLETFSGQPWWKGVIWWEWYPSSGSTTDSSRTPQGKTAETLLRDWYVKGWRPASPGDSVPRLAAGASPSGPAAEGAHIQSVSGASTVIIPGVVSPGRPWVMATASDPPAASLAHRDEVGLLGLVALIGLVAVAARLVLGPSLGLLPSPGPAPSPTAGASRPNRSSHSHSPLAVVESDGQGRALSNSGAAGIMTE